jgi:integrase
VASIRTRPGRDGGTKFTLLWREPDGTQTSATTDDWEKVNRWKAYLDVRGRTWRSDLFQAEQPAPVDTGPTLNQWARQHIEGLTRATKGTRETYTQMFARTFGKYLGSVPVADITRPQVAKALNALSARLSDKSVANAHGLLFSMLARAQEDGLIASHPCRGLALPRRTEHEKVEHRYLTPEEFERLVTEVPERYRPLVMFLAGTGCRWGEAVALNVGDIVSLHGTWTARITKASKWQAGKRPIGPPKTRKSRRTVALPTTLMPHLEPLLVDRERSALLFTAEKGAEVRHSYFRNKVWLPATKRAGLVDPQLRIHDLRHTHVAWLLNAQPDPVPLMVIQARLGHESIKTTMDVYGHLSPDLHIAAADAAAAVFRPKPPPELPGSDS